MKYLFAIIVLVHGLIHLMGFAKAFRYAAIKNITGKISRPAGLLWLITAMLFILALAGFLMDKSFWTIAAIAAALLSQILIATVWKDARFGTIANILILLVAIPAFARLQFQSMVNEEAAGLLSGVTLNNERITEEDLESLPPVVQKWLKTSGIVGTPQAYCARIRQRGSMRTKPDGKWMNFTAEQYIDLQKPGFVWSVKVDMMPLLYMDGRDKFMQGEGEMLIKMLSLISVVNEGQTDKMNSGSMLRYLVETTWFPSAVLSRHLRWESTDSLSAKATMSYQHTTVEGIFHFNETGDFLSFEAERYYGGGESATLEKWVVSADDYKWVNGLRVPFRNSVTWQLKEGDFTWLTLEITDMEINIPELFRD
jgi:hypothetical protein